LTDFSKNAKISNLTKIAQWKASYFRQMDGKTFRQKGRPDETNSDVFAVLLTPPYNGITKAKIA
jgi:hypothetical protein